MLLFIVTTGKSKEEMPTDKEHKEPPHGLDKR